MQANEREWTPQQRCCFENRDGTMLVSAAAGSGKTAVLVERIIRMITDREHPQDLTRLVIVTFTRAAAAEMRQRLSDRLSFLEQDDPADPLYQRLQLLLPQATITTIDGFCTDILRRYGGQLGLPSGFRIVEGNEASLLAQEALDATLEEFYTAGDEDFKTLMAQINERRGDRKIQDAVRLIYAFMQAQPIPERWLCEQIAAYAAELPLSATPWEKSIRQEASFRLDLALHYYDRAIEICSDADLGIYAPFFEAEREQLRRLRDVADVGTYDEVRRAIAAFRFDRLPTQKTDSEAREQAKKEAQALRNAVKDIVVKIVSPMLCGDEEQARAELRRLYPLVSVLGRIVLRYDALFRERKRAEKMLDFNDLEHDTLRLLTEDGETPTALARELSARYDEIMVDEYQDTNAAQDTLFRLLAGERGRLFFVGDVKQSIYGFRQAMPEIFTGRRDEYLPFDPSAPAYPATVTLGNNFRSRETVTETVNFMFRQLMHTALGGVEYDEREALVYSARYDGMPGYEPTFMLVEGDLHAAEKVSCEGRLIATRIKELLDTAMVRDDHAPGGKRPLRQDDIAILFRSRARMSDYVKELEKAGLSAIVDGTDDLLSTPEVATVLSLLRVIDNPLREIELSAVMLSPLYGFTPDECAAVRMPEQKSTPLYAVIAQIAGREDALGRKCAMLMSDLRRFRTMAVTFPADRLIERIYRHTNAEPIFSARSGGAQRIANLRQLDRMAREFEKGGFRGLSAFVRRMDEAEKAGKCPVDGANTGDGVRLMTVHGSKGLEFPVVFLANLTSDFSRKSTVDGLLCHGKNGIGLRWLDVASDEKVQTLPYGGVKSAIRMGERAEELRLWYVALTRARERLYFVISDRDIRSKLQKLERMLTADRAVMPGALLSANSPAEWFLLAGLRHAAFSAYRNDSAHTASLPCRAGFTVEWLTPPTDEAETIGEALPTVAPVDDALARRLRERLDYCYPYTALASVPVKLAASQAAHPTRDRGNVATARPAFLQQAGLTPAQKGTAMHTFMQFARFSDAAADLGREADRLLAAGFLTSAQRQALRPDKLRAFFDSPLYGRIAASEWVRREFPFTLEVSASELCPAATDETIVEQGIADCVFREGDGLVLVDYKTDRLSPEELRERYRAQLMIYRRALTAIFGLPIREMLLYSFHNDEAVTVSISPYPPADVE